MPTLKRSRQYKIRKKLSLRISTTQEIPRNLYLNNPILSMNTNNTTTQQTLNNTELTYNTIKQLIRVIPELTLEAEIKEQETATYGSTLNPHTPETEEEKTKLENTKSLIQMYFADLIEIIRRETTTNPCETAVNSIRYLDKIYRALKNYEDYVNE